MSKQLTISFVIPCFNCASTVAESIDSILQTNVIDGDEILLVDDCSTDNTLAVLDSYARRYPFIKIFRHRINKSTAAAARNTAIEQAGNELVFCLDSDNVLAPDSIRPLKQHLQDSHADAAAFGEIWYFDESTTRITHKCLFPSTVTLADALAGHHWPGPSGNYLFTRASWINSGRYFEPTLENQTLDSWTFGIRQLGTGHKMVTLPQSGYYHRHGHQSHHVRHVKRGSVSLSALIGIMPFLDQLDPADVDYIFSAEGRHTWFEHLNDHPLRVRGMAAGQSGHVQQFGSVLLQKLRRQARRLRS